MPYVRPASPIQALSMDHVNAMIHIPDQTSSLSVGNVMQHVRPTALEARSGNALRAQADLITLSQTLHFVMLFAQQAITSVLGIE